MNQVFCPGQKSKKGSSHVYVHIFIQFTLNYAGRRKLYVVTQKYCDWSYVVKGWGLKKKKVEAFEQIISSKKFYSLYFFLLIYEKSPF